MLNGYDTATRLGKFRPSAIVRVDKTPEQSEGKALVGMVSAFASNMVANSQKISWSVWRSGR